MLIALSSFGESLRWAPPEQIPAEACHLKKFPRLSGGGSRGWRFCFTPYASTTGKTTVKVLPAPTLEFTQIRPL